MEPNEVQVIPALQRLAVLEAIIAALAPFAAPTVILYQNAVSLAPTTALADLTPATFVGYAATVGMVWGTPYIDSDGSALVFGALITQICTSAATPNTIYGYALTNVGVTLLLAAYQFATPQGIAVVDAAVSFLPALRYSGN
jgi:hypothetical protein